jgi:hypothetical protein
VVRQAGFFDVVSDFPARGCGWGGEFTDGVEQRADAGVVAFNLALQLGQFVGKFLVQGERRSQPHEHPHDGNVDLNGARAAQDARQHGDAFLCEDLRQILEVLAPL